MLLTGTFSEYPLPLLLEILQHKEETGLLEISSAEQSGYVFLKKGDVKRCDFGSVSGAKAIELAKSVSNASFHFRPLESTDYARVAWQSNFGLNETTKRSNVRVQVQASLLQLLSYLEAAYSILKDTALRIRSYFLPNPLISKEAAPELESVSTEEEIADRTHSYAASGKVDSQSSVSLSEKPLTQSRQVAASSAPTPTKVNEAFSEGPRSQTLIEGSQHLKRQLAIYRLRQFSRAYEAMQSLRSCAAATATTTQNNLTRTWMSVSGLCSRYANRALGYITIHSRTAAASLHQKVSEAQIAMRLGKDRIISNLRVNLDGISPLIRGPMNRALEYITIQSRGASASLHQRVSDAQIAMGLGKDRFISYLRVNLDRVPPLVRGRMNSLQSVPGVAWSRVTSLSSQITAANVMIRTSRVSYPSAKEVRAWSEKAQLFTKNLFTRVIGVARSSPPIILNNIANDSRSGLTVTRNSATHLPSFRRFGEDNLSFGIIVSVLIAASGLTIFALLRDSQPNNFAATEESVVNPAESNTSPLSKPRRVQRKRRTKQKNSSVEKSYEE